MEPVEIAAAGSVFATSPVVSDAGPLTRSLGPDASARPPLDFAPTPLVTLTAPPLPFIACAPPEIETAPAVTVLDPLKMPPARMTTAPDALVEL